MFPLRGDSKKTNCSHLKKPVSLFYISHSGVLELAIEAAEKGGSNHILASDPDADRLAVAEKVDGKWKVFSGNELGALFGWWAVQNWKKSGSNEPDYG